MRRALLVGLVLVLTGAGCAGVVGDPCPGCTSDAGSTDSGTDSGTSTADSGADASVEVDAGNPTDAGGVDAGAVDAGAADAGAADAGSRAIFVIGGQDQRHLVSFDGKTWGQDTYIAPNGLDNAYSGGSVGNGVVVLSGDPGVLHSTDGLSWTLTAMPNLHGSKVTFAQGHFVMVAHSSAYTSTDGVTWVTNANTGDSGHWQDLVFGNGHYVAIGDGHRKTSEDGASWHDYNATADANPLAALAFGNGVFVGVGGANGMGRVVTSTDGVNWTEQAPIATSYSTGMAGVTFGDGLFVSSDCCNAFESADGVTWVKRGRGTQSALVFAHGVIVGAGWRTEAVMYDRDAGQFVSTFSGDRPNLYEDGGIAPWFTTVVAGSL